MPYTIPMVHQDALEVVEELHGGVEGLLPAAATVVAAGFTRYTGERFEVGVSSLAYPPIISSGLPVDLALIIVADWTKERAEHFEAIRQTVEEEVAGWYDGRLRVEVHLDHLGYQLDPELLVMPVRDLLDGVPYVSERATTFLTRHDHCTVGDLIKLSVRDLEAINDLGPECIKLIRVRLKDKGLSLRPED